MSNLNRLDVIIFGASGFTGKLLILELTKLIRSEKLSLTWGIAGRSEEKLKKTLSDMGNKMNEDYTNIPVILANLDNTKSLEEMTGKAKLIITTVGPFSLYGEIVVEACIKTGTHLVDICAISYVETDYFDKIHLRFGHIAQEKGVYIVSGCALDTLPADLGMIFLQNNFKGAINSIDSYLYYREDKNYPGPIAHYGTYESMIRGYASTMKFREILKTISLRRPGMFKSHLLNKWCILFPGSDHSALHKTQEYMKKTYGQKAITIRNYLGTRHFLEFILSLIMFPPIALMTRFTCTKDILLNNPKFFTFGQTSHEGPSEEKQEDMEFNAILVGEGCIDEVPKKTIVRISGKNPGYRSTCMMAALSAIMILTESEKMPSNGGYYSPGAAFAKTSIIEKLNKYGIKFELNPCI